MKTRILDRLFPARSTSPIPGLVPPPSLGSYLRHPWARTSAIPGVVLLFAVLGIAGTALLVTGVNTHAAGATPIKSLRGDTPLTEEPSAAVLQDPPKDHAPEARNYLHQPPLIPHTIRDYNITRTHNKCMECHSWQRYREFGATKISLTHFKDRSGTDLANVSPLRYFCTQCHVPQTDTKPLVENTFRPVEAITPSVK